MAARAERSTAPWGWWGVCGVLAVAMCAEPLAPHWQGTLDWQPGLITGQPWRWWTPVAVHYSLLHGAANLAGLLLVAALGAAARLPWPAALAWALAWPITHLGLALRPELLHYGGASGVLHAGVAVASLWLAWRGTGRHRWVGVALGLGLAAKVLGEAPWGPVLQQREGWDIAIAPWAHATGAMAGWLCALPCAALRPWRRSTGTSSAPRP